MVDKAPPARTKASRRRTVAARLATLGLVLGAVAGATACSEDAVCAPDLCPAGTHCDDKTGLCTAVADAAEEPLGWHGRFSLVRPPAGQLGVVGYLHGARSLGWLQRDDAGWHTTWIAGPATGEGESASGQVSAAVHGPDGGVHAAWLRASDATLWYGSGGGSGWTREAVDVAGAGTVGRELAVGLWVGLPTIAWQATDTQGILVARRDGPGNWKVEAVPPPPPVPGQAVAPLQLGRGLAMAVMPTGPAITSYEAVRGDLVLAVRTASGWSVARIAGSDPVTGADTGDMGLPSALAVGPGGTVAVAYRDRSRGRVMVARAKAGVVTHSVVADGSRDVPGTDVQRVDVLGTALAIALLPDGRAVVALQDASRLQIEVAVEQATGGFVRHQVPGNGRALAWPAVLPRDDGSVLVAGAALDLGHGPGATRLVTWLLPAGGVP